MEIKDNKSYLNLWIEQKEAGFTREIVSKIVFQADLRDNKCIEVFQNIKDWLESNYKMYQYKDNGIKYGDHELFYWASWETPESHFTIDLNEKLSFDYRIKLIEQIVKYLKDNYSEINGFIKLQYQNCMDWNLVNKYISILEIDYNNIPYDKLRSISYFQFTGDWKYLTGENIYKLNNIQQELFKTLENKKVIYNGITGTLKKIDDYGTYGVFKPRATRTYFSIDLGKIKELKIAV